MSNSTPSVLAQLANPKLIKLINGNTPIGYVAFTTTLSATGKTIASIFVSSKNPKDKWDSALGRKVATARFLNPKNLTSFEVKNSSLEDVRQSILAFVANSRSNVASDSARKAATVMLRDQTGEDIKRSIRQYLTGNKRKVAKKVELLRATLDLVVDEHSQLLQQMLTVSRSKNKTPVVTPVVTAVVDSVKTAKNFVKNTAKSLKKTKSAVTKTSSKKVSKK